KRLMPFTNSCANPISSKINGMKSECGYCFFCLMRRAGLHWVGWDEEVHNCRDILKMPDILCHPKKSKDIKAILLGIRTWAQNPQKLLDNLLIDVPEAKVLTPYYYIRPLLSSGFRELAQLIQDKNPAILRSFVNW
ncbi:MAG: hypothetical protein ONB05_10625, partial [candidate division KSB1 bacterium]|nr:hypothetical protein [candidate division KSB1 bacterium]